MNFFDDCEAPPIKKPSIAGIVANCRMLLLLTDPPYKTIGNFLILKFLLYSLFINSNIFINSYVLGTLPVPMDQIGS